MKINPGQKTCCMQKRNGGYWLHTMHFSNIPVFVASTKEKIYQLSAIDFYLANTYGSLPKIFITSRIHDRFSYARFEIYIQTVFHPNSFLFFFGFNIVCQLLARHLSKEIEKIKNYSESLKLFLLKSDHPLHVRI